MDTKTNASAVNVSLGFKLVYFGETVTTVGLGHDADVNLFTESNTVYRAATYYIRPSSTQSYLSSGVFMYRSEQDSTRLRTLADWLLYSTVAEVPYFFVPTNALIITWYQYPAMINGVVRNNSFQLILTTDGTQSFMIFLVDIINGQVYGGQTTFFTTPVGYQAWSDFTNSFSTNCGKWGLRIFRVDGQGKKPTRFLIS
jgi:hypothetical protein